MTTFGKSHSKLLLTILALSRGGFHLRKPVPQAPASQSGGGDRSTPNDVGPQGLQSAQRQITQPCQPLGRASLVPAAGILPKARVVPGLRVVLDDARVVSNHLEPFGGEGKGPGT